MYILVKMLPVLPASMLAIFAEAQISLGSVQMYYNIVEDFLGKTCKWGFQMQFLDISFHGR